MKYCWRFLVAGMVILSAVLISGGEVIGDHFIKQVNHTDAIEVMGQKQPAVDDTVTIWLTDGKSCMQSKDGMAYLFIGEKGTIYTIDHPNKTYTEVSLDFSRMFEAADEDADAESQANAEMMKTVMKNMMESMQITVTPTEETKKIGEWNTTKYVMNMSMPMAQSTSEMWVTDEIDVDLKSFQSVMNSQMAAIPGYDKILAEMEKMKGIPIYGITSSQVMGNVIKNTIEIIEFSQKDAPAGIFAVPEGYQKVAPMQMPMRQ